MAQFIAMGAATPLDHDAHRSPARQDDLTFGVGLRRKSESDCGFLEIKTPTERTAGALACVVDTESKIAFHKNSNTSTKRNAIVENCAGKKDARERGAPRAVSRTSEGCAAASVKMFNTFAVSKSTGRGEVVHHNIESDSGPIKTPAQDETEAGESLGRDQITLGASERQASTYKAAGTSGTNAWLLGRIYRVDASLSVEVLS